MISMRESTVRAELVDAVDALLRAAPLIMPFGPDDQKVEWKSNMPIVFEKDGFKFFFYSNDHRPIHVHVRHGDGEAVFDVEEGVDLRESQNMKVSELSKAQRLAREHRPLIVEKWYEHLG